MTNGLSNEQVYFLETFLGIVLPDPDDEGPLSLELYGPLREIVESYLATLPAYVAILAQTDADSANQLTAKVDSARTLRDQGDLEGAFAVLEHCEQVIAEARFAAIAAEAGAPKSGTVELRKAKLAWNDARRSMEGEIAKLKAAIIKICEGDEELEEIVDQVDELDDHFDAFDENLSDILDDLINSDESPERDTLKREARAQIVAYDQAFGSEFFKSVDSNGFVSTSVISTARGALAQVANTLV